MNYIVNTRKKTITLYNKHMEMETVILVIIALLFCLAGLFIVFIAKKEIKELPSEKPKVIHNLKEREMNVSIMSQDVRNDRRCVYISSDTQLIISKIVNLSLDKRMSIGRYVDLVLREHLKENKDEINRLYSQNREDLIK